MLILGSDKGERLWAKEKLIKTKFISFGFVVVDEFLIKNPLLELERIKKLAAAAAFAFSSNLKSVHLARFYVCFISHCTCSLFFWQGPFRHLLSAQHSSDLLSAKFIFKKLSSLVRTTTLLKNKRAKKCTEGIHNCDWLEIIVATLPFSTLLIIPPNSEKKIAYKFDYFMNFSALFFILHRKSFSTRFDKKEILFLFLLCGKWTLSCSCANNINMKWYKISN